MSKIPLIQLIVVNAIAVYLLVSGIIRYTNNDEDTYRTGLMFVAAGIVFFIAAMSSRKLGKPVEESKAEES